MIDQSKLSPGLYLVALPIGNANDITLRALDTLKRVDIIACEDTRTTDRLLKHHAIQASMTCYNDHSTDRDRNHLLHLINDGKAVALVSDAGTPLISDPGYKLVVDAYEQHIPVVSLPGPCALIMALTLSGLPSNRFLFEGFLPSKEKARRDHLEAIKHYEGTLIFYESPNRVGESLKDMADILGGRDAALLRELTKTYEEIQRSPLPELYDFYEKKGNPKGEVVIIVGPPLPKTHEVTGLVQVDVTAMLTLLLKTQSLKDAVAMTVQLTGLGKNDVYQLALTLKGD
ncbi:MAG: 16S rRNA (cytidine(1402)-2'-O)-methyltransferase [Alphaproteobacteria bacterium]|nr:16S rRNA (cytidine(1402)-2'-O)-methyltransferase [Alphaproteobacteria bacterium]